MPCDTYWQQTTDFKSEKQCQLFGTDNKGLSVATRISNDGSSVVAVAARPILKKAEQFEDDYDNNNYSDYVEDASVHAVTDIRLGLRWRAFIQTKRRQWHRRRYTGKKTAGVLSRRSLIQGTITKRLGCPPAKLIVRRLVGRALDCHSPVAFQPPLLSRSCSWLPPPFCPITLLIAIAFSLPFAPFLPNPWFLVLLLSFFFFLVLGLPPTCAKSPL